MNCLRKVDSCVLSYIVNNFKLILSIMAVSPSYRNYIFFFSHKIHKTDLKCVQIVSTYACYTNYLYLNQNRQTLISEFTTELTIVGYPT